MSENSSKKPEDIILNLVICTLTYRIYKNIENYKKKGTLQNEIGNCENEHKSLKIIFKIIIGILISCILFLGYKCNEEFNKNGELQDVIGELQNVIGKLQSEIKDHQRRNGELQNVIGKLQSEIKEHQRLNENCANCESTKIIPTFYTEILILCIIFLIYKCREECKKKEKLQSEVDRRKAQYKCDWRKASLYADWRKEEFQTVTVILEEDINHPSLSLSQQRRCITWQEEDQDLPDTPQGLDFLPFVLGQLRITSGRYFWEVDIEDTVSYDLGICRDNVTRKGRVTMSPQNGFWVIRLYEGEYWALTSPKTRLSLREHPRRVGIFLDYNAGDVSFYNMTDGSHIFSFPQNTSQGVIRPLFRLWASDSGSLSIVH